MALLLVIAALIALVLFITFIAIIRSFIALALAVLVALVAGLIAESVVGDSRRNPLFTLLVGFIGAIVGAIIAHVSGLPEFISIGGLPVIWTIIGAIVVVFVWHLVRPEHRAIS